MPIGSVAVCVFVQAGVDVTAFNAVLVSAESPELVIVNERLSTMLTDIIVVG